MTVAPLTLEAVAGNSSGTLSRAYVNTFLLVALTLVTFAEILYSRGITPDILIGVPTSRL